MPTSLKLQHQFEDDLQVVFVESQGASLAQAEAFAIARRWRGSRALWTNEVPFDTGSRSLPYAVLLGIDGRVIFKGNPLERAKDIERLLVEQIRIRDTPPAGVTNAVRPAWGEFARGRYGRAFEALRAIGADASDDPEIERARREFGSHLDRELARVGWMIDQGFTQEAASRLADLQREVKGEAEIERRCAELATRLAAPALALERAAAAELARVQARFFESGGDATVGRELAACAGKHAGTRAAERAFRLVQLARGPGAPLR